MVKSNNRLVRWAKLSEKDVREIIRLYAQDLEAKEIAGSTGFNRNTVNRYLTKLRMRIAERRFFERPVFSNMEKEAVFRLARPPKSFNIVAPATCLLHGVLWENGDISLEPSPAQEEHALRLLLSGRFVLFLYLRQDDWAEYTKMVSLEYPIDRKNLKLNAIPARQEIEITDRILNVLDYTRQRIFRKRGIGAQKLAVHLKESEFRFGRKPEELFEIILSMLEEKPLKEGP